MIVVPFLNLKERIKKIKRALNKWGIAANLVVFFFSSDLSAQLTDPGTSKNVLYGNFSLLDQYGIAYSLNYERRIIYRPDALLSSYYLRLSGGVIEPADENTALARVNILALTGQYSRHAEIGAGLDVFISDDKDQPEYLPNFNIGYRLQPYRKGYMIRIGSGFPEIFYLGAGITF